MAKSSKISSNLIPQIYKSRKTILSLLKTQGFNVDDYSEFSNSHYGRSPNETGLGISLKSLRA